MAAAALIWPALRQWPPGLARQRCAGRPAADGAQAGAGLILTGSRLESRGAGRLPDRLLGHRSALVAGSRRHPGSRRAHGRLPRRHPPGRAPVQPGAQHCPAGRARGARLVAKQAPGTGPGSGSRPPAARNVQPAAEPARTVQRHRSPDQKGLPLNVTCPAARVRPADTGQATQPGRYPRTCPPRA
jgi:hypothetical protein